MPKKSKYRVLNPISWFGERVERGTILEMTKADAFNIGEKYLEFVKKTKEKKDESQADASKIDAPLDGSEIDI